MANGVPLGGQFLIESILSDVIDYEEFLARAALALAAPLSCALRPCPCGTAWRPGVEL